MSRQKFIHIRVPLDLHEQLTEYCKAHLTPISVLVLRLITEKINYKPRSVDPEHLPKPIPTPPGKKDGDWFECDDDGDIDWEDLKRRAANAPLKPVQS